MVFLNTFTGSQITPSMILPAHPFGPDVRAELSPQLQKLVFDPRSLGAGEVTISNNFGPDKVNSWNFGFEREITRNSAMELRYVGNHAYNLFQTVNGNPIVTGNSTAPAGLTGCTNSQVLLGPGQTANPALGRADCSKGLVLERNNGGFSNYHGLQAEFRANNLFKQLGVRAAYTYSRTLDNVSEIFSSGVAGNTLAFAQNPWDTGRGEYSSPAWIFRTNSPLQPRNNCPSSRASMDSLATCWEAGLFQPTIYGRLASVTRRCRRLLKLL